MSDPRLESPISVGGCSLRNRLYRAPLLECAGNGPDAVDALIADLEPAAASGAGLIHQGATIVRGEGGCAAPGMTRVADPAFVSELGRLTDAVHARGGAIAIQLEHGGLRSMEVWHAGYRESNPGLEQLAVSRPPGALRALDRVGMLELNPRVMDTGEVRELAADFGRAAANAVDAGYDMIHLAGANMGIIQQFLSPFYNRRDDEFGIDPQTGSGIRFLECVHDEIRDRAGDVALITKVPSESAAPAVFRPRLSDDDAVRTAARLAAIGYDGLVPVRCSVFWDMSIVRGAFPAAAWRAESLRPGYVEAFGGPGRAAAVAAGNWVQSRYYDREPGWNAPLARRVRERVDVPVFLEGGLRTRGELDRYLGDAADLVGMGRPFYAEPRLPARLLDGDRGTEAVCEDCNNCAVAQAAGASGACRTPAVLRRAGELREEGAYDRTG
ncbi:NADH:flavin oxidoreductase [Natronomonas sp.]|uniref:oxidoreductase n=1 Tax=Natronomonas sp. TaxID=2184060 RepID=UPI00260B3B0A|nr:NADH:flavin oxidoreductase [Natronomonas sp.]